MIPDKLLINLKILGKIQKNGRISKSCDGVVSLERDSYLQGLWRTFTNDSRKQTMYEINNIVNDIQPTLDVIYNSKFMNKDNAYTDVFYKTIEELKMLIDAMIETGEGLKNLRFTYIQDINISAQMDVIIFRVVNLIRDAKQKYSYYCTLVQMNPVFELEEVTVQSG